MKTNEAEQLRRAVREKYGEIAEAGAERSTSCCGPGPAEEILPAIGYTSQQAASIPDGANLGLGCGNPLAFAGVQPGETVLDLGSGAGIDCFLAAAAVGPSGHVIGVDMTPAMIEKARANASRGGYGQVEFRLGEIESLPVQDASVDLIISNCVINLSPDKPRVFREALRVLKPGGRLLVSDVVLKRALPAAVKESVDAWVGCVAGAILRDEYLAAMREAGFRNVEVVSESSYGCGDDGAVDAKTIQEGLGAVVSIKVRGEKSTHGLAD